MTADVVCVCGHAKLHHYIHLVGELGVCKADDCRCLQYVPQPLQPHIDSDRTLSPSDWDRECQESARLNRGR